MKYLAFTSLLKLAFLYCVGISSFANAQPQTEDNRQQQQRSSIYNYVEAFNPNFYTSTGTPYRSASGKPGHQYWQNAVNYKIKAHLDEDTRSIQANVVIDYTNNSPDELEFLWLQLDQNLFDKNSRGSVSVMGKSRYGDEKSTFDGGYTITSVKDITGKDLSFEISDTRMQVFLSKNIPANGGKKQLEIAYTYVVPEQGADRTGVLKTQNGEIFAIAQWYPRLCVYDDILGWNTHPYTGPGEFYLEYGDFDLEVTTPASHIVVCGAELLNPEQVFTAEQLKRYRHAKLSDSTLFIRGVDEVTDPNSRPKGSSTLTWKFKLTNARDIAWASSSAFVLDGAKINVGKNKTALALSAYPVESYGNNAWERSTEYTKASVEHYSVKWMEYPYPVAVNVAANLGGMEYPAISFCSYRSRGSSLWGVTDHEFGHNWVPMIVGSNERLYGWMDEGLNMFMNGISTSEFNQGEYHRPLGNANRLALAYTNTALEPIMTSPQNMQERNIGTLLYYKPAFGLTLLRDQILGHERFDRAFKAYLERWAYKHPTPEDFFRTIENVSGESLNWFWRGWFYNNWQLDQGIADVSYASDSPADGVYIVVENLEQLPMPVHLELRTVSGTKHSIKLPVEIWERNTSFRVFYPSTEAIAEVIIDPDHVFPDINIDNNRWISN